MIRFLDILLASVGLIILTPVFLLVSILIKFNSNGPIFFKQIRIGLFGCEFGVLKFRTMKIDSERLSLITIGGRDVRVTSFGYYLRKFKIDELPQLINVIKGDMSLVGPRPEVKKYVDLYTKEQLRVLSIRPGITDWASIYYRNENELLGQSFNPENDYIKVVMQSKLKYNLIYLENYGLVQYLKILFYTFCPFLVTTGKKSLV